MTQLYTHISQRAMQEAAEKYEQKKAEAMAQARKTLEEEQTTVRVQ